MKGGYKIIDFKNVSLSDTPVTMADVLVDLLNNYEKVVLLSHVVLSGSAKDDCFSTVLSDGNGGVKLNCYDGYISINSSGAVTYTVASASGMAGDIAELTAEIGDLDDLETTDNNSVVGAINEVNLGLTNLKKAVIFKQLGTYSFAELDSYLNSVNTDLPYIADVTDSTSDRPSTTNHYIIFGWINDTHTYGMQLAVTWTGAWVRGKTGSASWGAWGPLLNS